MITVDDRAKHDPTHTHKYIYTRDQIHIYNTRTTVDGRLITKPSTVRATARRRILVSKTGGGGGSGGDGQTV